MPVLLSLSLLFTAGGPATSARAPTPAYLVATQPEPEAMTLEFDEFRDDARDDGRPRWGAIGLHYGIGVMATAGGVAASYGLGSWIGHRGNGLAGPLIGLLIGALLPPLIITTAQWGIWQIAYPNKDRYWPSLIAAFACHLAVFVGSVLGGVSLEGNGVVGLVLLESFSLPAVTTATAYLTRYPDPVLASGPKGAPGQGLAMKVPLFRVAF